MEDPRLSRMYLRLATERLADWGRRTWQRVVLRSGVVTIAAVAFVVLGLALGWRAHTHGRFARLKAELKSTDVPHTPLAPRPGGQDALILERSAIEGGAIPEFLSATILPGRGMNVLQITASLPKKGVVKLLDSPTMEDAAKRMTGDGDDLNGRESLAMGGRLKLPGQPIFLERPRETI